MIIIGKTKKKEKKKKNEFGGGLLKVGGQYSMNFLLSIIKNTVIQKQMDKLQKSNQQFQDPNRARVLAEAIELQLRIHHCTDCNGTGFKTK